MNSCNNFQFAAESQTQHTGGRTCIHVIMNVAAKLCYVISTRTQTVNIFQTRLCQTESFCILILSYWTGLYHLIGLRINDQR